MLTGKERERESVNGNGKGAERERESVNDEKKEIEMSVGIPYF